MNVELCNLYMQSWSLTQRTKCIIDQRISCSQFLETYNQIKPKQLTKKQTQLTKPNQNHEKTNHTSERISSISISIYWIYYIGLVQNYEESSFFKRKWKNNAFIKTKVNYAKISLQHFSRCYEKNRKAWENLRQLKENLTLSFTGTVSGRWC